MHSRWLALSATVCCLAILAASCGGGDDDDPQEPTETPAPVPTTGILPTDDPGAVPTLTIDLADQSPSITVIAANPLEVQTGHSTVATGDVNGDGVDDLIIGLPFSDGPDRARPAAGEVVVIFGAAELAGDIDLASADVDLRILGATAGDNLGFTVGAGDLNGDGIDDVIVAAVASDGLVRERTDVGEIYVVFGGEGLGGTIDTLNQEQDFTFISAEGFSRTGSSFAVADVNGDGFDDLVIGAPFAGREEGTPPGGPRTTIGEVYVVFGGPDFGGSLSVARDEQDFTLAGLRSLDSFGLSVAAADVNGDGIADIIVGAKGFDGPDESRTNAGAVFVYFGSADLSGKRGVDDADFSILGREGDALGEVVSTGDFNGDGIADIVAVARTATGPNNARPNAGQAVIMYGSGELSSAVDLASGTTDAVVYGPQRASLLATSVAAVDLNGDGSDDLLLGAPLSSASGRQQAGVVYLVYGRALEGRIDLRHDVDDAVFIYGAAPQDGLGTGLASGDVTGDGTLEVIMVSAGPSTGDIRPARFFAIRMP